MKSLKNTGINTTSHNAWNSITVWLQLISGNHSFLGIISMFKHLIIII